MTMNDKVYLEAMSMAVKRLEKVTRLEEYSNGCPTCHRPFTGKYRAQVGDSHNSTAHEAAKTLGDTTKLAKKVLEHLQGAQHIRLTKSHRNTFDVENPNYLIYEGWISRDQLSEIVGGGDGARRARELRECGVPIESKMMDVKGFPRQAWYRLDIDYEQERIENEERHLLAQREYEQYLQEGLS